MSSRDRAHARREASFPGSARRSAPGHVADEGPPGLPASHRSRAVRLRTVFLDRRQLVGRKLVTGITRPGETPGRGRRRRCRVDGDGIVVRLPWLVAVAETGGDDRLRAFLFKPDLGVPQLEVLVERAREEQDGFSGAAVERVEDSAPCPLTQPFLIASARCRPGPRRRVCSDNLETVWSRTRTSRPERVATTSRMADPGRRLTSGRCSSSKSSSTSATPWRCDAGRGPAPDPLGALDTIRRIARR